MMITFNDNACQLTRTIEALPNVGNTTKLFNEPLGQLTSKDN
jgi:hypothetical protein